MIIERLDCGLTIVDFRPARLAVVLSCDNRHTYRRRSSAYNRRTDAIAGEQFNDWLVEPRVCAIV